MHEDNKVIFIALILFASFVIGLVFFINRDKEDTVDIPKNYGQIQLDEDGEEMLGDIEAYYFLEDGRINTSMATFDEEVAGEIGASKSVEVLYPEITELDETVVKKKKLYYIDIKDELDSEKLDYLFNYLIEDLTETEEHGVEVWVDASDVVRLHISSSVYTGLMTKYFPLKEEDPSCTDFHVDQDSAKKSLHLLIENLKLLKQQLLEEDLDMYFEYLGAETDMPDMVDENGKIIE